MIQLQAPLLEGKGSKNAFLINLAEAKLLLFGNLEPLGRVPPFCLDLRIALWLITLPSSVLWPLCIWQ